MKRLTKAVMTRSRDRKVAHFFSLCKEGDAVLDVGVSGKELPDQALNHFLSRYDRDPRTYTGLGIDDMSAIQSKYPSMKFIQYDGKVFPFEDKSFDWIFCNAVIEHVGTEADQLLFLNEMLRVAKSIYFTTPNMYFPIEAHSYQLLRHWDRARFDRWAERTNRPWLGSGRLRLLGFQDLTDLLQRSTAKRYEIFKNRLLGWPMTFSVVASE